MHSKWLISVFFALLLISCMKSKGDKHTGTNQAPVPEENPASKPAPDSAIAPSATGSWIVINTAGRTVNPEHLEVIPPSPQPREALRMEKEDFGRLMDEWIAPDADLGYWYLVNGDYQRMGAALESFRDSSPPLMEQDKLDGREPRNEGLAYLFNAVKAPNGNDVAAVTCLGCHFNHLEGRMVPGLGRAQRMVKIDATGGTANPIAIILTSIVKGDLLSTIANALDFIVRIAQGAFTHGHFMDIFADLAARHDPKTLEWTNKLSFDPSSGFRGHVDFPPWWNVKKKNALYFNGTGRGWKGDHMLYMSWFSVNGISEAEKIRNNFLHVQAWIETIQPPRYNDFSPTQYEPALAAEGKLVYENNCSTCHGTYAENEEDETFPNLLIHYEEVGTDPVLADNHWIYPAIDWYNSSWYGEDGKSSIVRSKGYVAQPLDGIWATAPYFHNGSVPTLAGVINPDKRPDVWTSDMGKGDFDYDAVGWKNKPIEDIQILTYDFSGGIYDTRRKGQSNAGHTYGAHLNKQEQLALLEYLKTL